jgi:uncharacterized protein YjdB
MRKALLLLAILAGSFVAGAQTLPGLVLNELSQGRTSSQKEYFEFVVAGTRTCTDSTLDLRGWIFDDNNGWVAAGSGNGIATGAMRFANVANWAKVPYGSVILIYSDIEKNNSITLPDDATDANHDYVYVLRANSNLLEKNLTDPFSPSSAGFTYTTTGWSTSGDWGTVALANGGDGVVIVKPTVLNNEYYSFGFVIGSAATATVWVPDMPGGKNYFLSDANFGTAGSWTQGDADINETPGASNGGANTTWINSMRIQVSGVTVNPLSSTNGSTLCTGGTTALSSTTPGGTWTSSDISVATVSAGVVTAVAPGTATITYTVTSGGCTGTATFSITVTASVNAGTVSGGPNVCTGQTVTYSSNGTPGGTWSSINTGVATVNPTTGVVTGITAGNTSITYTVGSGLCAGTASAPVTVNQTPVVAATTGSSTVCAGAATTLANASSGGTWSSANTATATVNTSGVVTGVAAGSTIINYTVTNGGCTTVVPFNMTVSPAANAGTVSGPANVCTGTSTAPYTTTGTAGGTWSSSNPGFAIIDPATGVLSALAAGGVNVIYTVTTVGCTATASTPVTIVQTPVLSPTTGTNNVCVGGQVTLTNPAVNGSGTWSSTVPGVATVLPTLPAGGLSNGIVTGVSAGTANINFTVTNGGCSSTVPFPFTVNALPVVGPVLGGTPLCSGATTTLSNATPGGIWTSSNTAAATVNPTTGVVTGVATGAAVVTYTVTNGTGCTGSSNTTINVTSTPAPGPITGTPNVCVGTTTALANNLAGGTWSSNNTFVATVNAITGVVTGIAPGTASIAYTVSNNGCTGVQSQTVTVNASPVLTPIADFTLCKNATATLTPSVAGGSWTSNIVSVGTITNSGVVTALSAGSTQLAYTVSNGGCSATQTVNLLVQDLAMQLTATPNPAQLGNTVTLASSGNGAHTITAWGPAATFLNQTATTQTITAAANAQYFVVGRNALGCIDTAFIDLVVNNTIDDLFVPNYFTPNNDGETERYAVFIRFISCSAGLPDF